MADATSLYLAISRRMIAGASALHKLTTVATMRARMSTRFSRAYLLVPVIYIGVIFGLLFLQFSGGERVTRSIGSLTITAPRPTSAGGGSGSVDDVSLDFEGLIFRFDSNSGMIVETRSNLVDVHVTDYEMIDDGVLVRFGDTMALRFIAPQSARRELEISLEMTESPGDLVEISIPFALADGAVVDQTRGSFVSIRNGDQEFYFSVPARASIDMDNGKVVLHASVADQSIRYVEAATGDPAIAAAWFSDPALALSDDALSTRIAEFVSRAYSGWASGRYHAGELAWDTDGGRVEFSEAILTAYLAEAWRRNDYDRAYAEMRRARDLHADELTLLSAPFLGNLEPIVAATLESDRALSSALEAGIADDDAVVFQTDDLVPFASDRGSDELLNQLLAFVGTVDPNTLDLFTATALLANVEQAVDGGWIAPERVTVLTREISDTLLGAIVNVDTEFFLQSAPGQSDLFLSARAGAALLQHGSRTGNTTLVVAGRHLIVSVVALADQNGMIPATVLLSDQDIELSDESIGPESLYRYLVANDAYPRHHSLTHQLGTATWVWSAVPLSVVGVTGTEWRFSLEYPRLRTHYLVIGGVPEFESMDLFGQTWRDAPDFEVYSKGRHYVEDERVLLIKYYDDSVRRDVVLRF